MAYRVKHWESFQHYKHRRPPWIKLHRSLLDNYDFASMPDCARALAPMLWLIASESSDGTISDDLAELAFRLRQDEAWVRQSIKSLIDKGFLECLQDAGEMLAAHKQNVTTEKSQSRGRVEAETEERKEGSPTSPARSRQRVSKESDALAKRALDYWHDRWVEKSGSKPSVAGARDMAILKRLTAGRTFDECKFVVDQLMDFPPRKNGEPIAPTLLNLAYHWNTLLYRKREGGYAGS